MMKCKKCGTLDTLTTAVELKGGYATRLCDDCRNEWTRHIRKSDAAGLSREAISSRDHLKARATAGDAPEPDLWGMLAVLEAGMEDACFQEAELWVNQKVEPRKETDDG